TSTPIRVDSASAWSPPAGIRQKNPQPGALRLPGEFSGDRPYFAAIEAKIAQCMVIESPKGVVYRRRTPPLPIARIGPSRGGDSGFEHRAQDRAKRERPVCASDVIELIAR